MLVVCFLKIQFLSALDEMEYHCVCVCDMSDAVLKSRPQSIQEPSLHHLHNWVNFVQLLSIQWQRNWVSSPKCCQNQGKRERRITEKYWKVNEYIFILPCPHCIERTLIHSKCDTWESFWQPCLDPEVLHLSSTGLQSLSHSIITKGLCSPSLLYMQSSHYWTGYKLCYFLHLTKNCSFVERWFERPTIT